MFLKTLSSLVISEQYIAVVINFILNKYMIISFKQDVQIYLIFLLSYLKVNVSEFSLAPKTTITSHLFFL